MRSSGDYSATFLPGLVAEEQCRGKDGKLNKPICIAWSSSGRNHYIPLVGIKNTVLPKLPARLLPKAWGVPQELIRKYIKLEPDGSCVIGGDRSLQDKYLMRLVNAMEDVFMEKHSIHPSLVADVHQYVYRRTGVIGIQPEEVTEAAKKSVMENRLHRCLICGALSELHVPPEWLVPGGKLYNLAKSTHGQLRPDKNYSFPLNNVVCSYDPQRDVLLPDYKLSSLNTCNWCHGTSVRHIHGNGSVVYLDDGIGPTPAPRAGSVGVASSISGRERTGHYKHFPGEFGSEILVQKVVNTILHHTAKKNPDEYNPVSIDGAHVQRLTDATETQQAADPQPPTKIILTEHQRAAALVTQKRRTDKLKQEQKGHGRTSSPGGSPETSSSSAPATPTKSSSPSSSNKEKKIRVTTSDGRQAMLTLQAHTTFSELQRSIANQFGVPPAQQCIRYGFPPKELMPPKDSEENEPVALQHGDRVTVEILRGPEDKGPATSIPQASSSHSVKSEDAVMSGRMSSRELQDSIDLEMSSLCLLATLMGEDVWSYAKKLPHLFQQGGVFYNIVKKDMGLMDGKHCTLPHLTGKTFVYNAAEERLELCVDAAGHFPVGPEVEELVKEALVQLRSEAATRGSREGSPSHGSAGGSSPPEHRPITRQHSSGVDLSASVSRGPPDLSDIPEDATRELVRMAPGFVTMKDGRGLDPSLMEQQRRKLQEMVSSIQASMERHLREQQSVATAGGGTSQERTGGTKTGADQPTSTVDHGPPAAAGVTEAGKPDRKAEEPEEMESQDAGQNNATEPMDHS
ncbi:hypothetical protein L3Q82_006001 [Scortum barcoo]|uniref:Uncharacterized protein n=1 Tax=Scortum barcoo TaxID=214431 RepID=A0ACB8X3N0_9TELE|nr:hypothetical protein L3Q82_006001 [Scortum barcoo]